MRLHITNGRLVDPKNKRDGRFDLLIEGAKVYDILKPGAKISGAEVINAKGCLVAPGFVDLHTHLREPGYEYKETIQTGTLAAARGGFTSILCMANTNPVNDHAAITEYILKQARERGSVNVYPVGAVTKGLKGEELAEMGELKRAGCVAVSDDGETIQNAQLMRCALEYAKTFDLPLISHAVDQSLAAEGVMNEGFVSTRLGLAGIPHEAEDMMVGRDVALAKLTGAKLHLAHLSTAGGVDIVADAKKEGIRVTCEVTPHHLALTDEAVGTYSTNSKMMPPLRTEGDRRALIRGIREGVIDAIATDHAPHAAIDKEVEFDSAAFGVVGLETALGVVLGVLGSRKIPLSRIIALLTVGPARVAGIAKGALGKNDDADLVIFDPEESYPVDPQQLASKSKNTPFAGRRLKGKVKWTIVGGKIVYKDPTL